MLADVGKIEALEGEFAPTGSVVVAGDAVLSDGCLEKFGLGGRLRLSPEAERCRDEGGREEDPGHEHRCSENGRQRQVS
jgi:hypothetical protein